MAGGMSRKKNERAPAKAAGRNDPADHILPVETSVGYQIRMAHRALQRYLQAKIEPHGVTVGMWWYLRVLWEQDGLTQSELSNRIETMEPSTLSAIHAMEKSGIVRRVRDKQDRRKLHVFLTPKGRRLKAKLLPLAREVVDAATADIGRREIEKLLDAVRTVRRNVRARMKEAGTERE
jgi:DNA-binding MarR family transcriptional regulator